MPLHNLVGKRYEDICRPFTQSAAFAGLADIPRTSTFPWALHRNECSHHREWNLSSRHCIMCSPYRPDNDCGKHGLFTLTKTPFAHSSINAADFCLADYGQSHSLHSPLAKCCAVLSDYQGVSRLRR